MNKIELLAPAGSLEKLKFACVYGADAVYIGGKKYGLRAFADNFDLEEIKEGVEFAHARNVKVYVTVNMFAHNDDLEGLEDYLKDLESLNIDAIICADPGVIKIALETVPELKIHLSTQANNTNWSSAKFWQEQGVERIVLARELSVEEIKTIKEKTNVQIETFVHGAMCISYSGRCLLSNYMTERDANQGECAQACRWNYNLVEQKRPGVYYPIVEDEKGSYIFNSQDLCLIEHLEKLVNAGIDSFKIEGRMKSINYVSTVLRAYRNALDIVLNKGSKKDLEFWKKELEKVSHRPYTTGFYFGSLEEGALTLDSSKYIRPFDFVGVVLDYDSSTKMATIEQRNNFKLGETVEFFGPDCLDFQEKIEKIIDNKGFEVYVAPHARQIVKVPVSRPVKAFDLMRRER